jgi:hypothetical protein
MILFCHTKFLIKIDFSLSYGLDHESSIFHTFKKKKNPLPVCRGGLLVYPRFVRPSVCHSASSFPDFFCIGSILFLKNGLKKFAEKNIKIISEEIIMRYVEP